MRVLFCGDRNWSDRERIHTVMSQLAAKCERTPGDSRLPASLIIIHGAARGADTIAGEVAIDLHLPWMVFPARWKVYGRAAGPIRNHQMLEEGKPDLVCAFHDDLFRSRGTSNMVRIAQVAGIPVRVYTTNPATSFAAVQAWQGGSYS